MRISQPLAERGDDVAQFQLGTLFLNGLGVERNHVEALKWFQMSANNDNVNAQYVVGNMYLHGLGITNDSYQSFFWRKKAADNRQPFAAYEVAEMYMSGLGIQKNMAEARKYYQQFIDANISNTSQTAQEKIINARARIIEINASSKTVRSSNSDVSEYKTAQREASDLTLTKALADIKQERYSKARNQQVVDPAFLAKSPVAASATSVTRVPENGDAQETFKRVKALASKSDTNAQVQLASMYETGQGVKQSYANAYKWYRIAADKNSAAAQHRLGQMVSEGIGVGQDFTEAVKWFQLAANQGDLDSQVEVGEMYSLGKGVAQNDSEAATWYRMAAMQGSPNAQYALGGLYRLGRGVVQNNDEALRWYQLASRQGNARAKAAIDLMLFDMAARERVKDASRRAEQMQQEQRQGEIERQQAESDRAEQKKAKCIADGDTVFHRLECVDHNARTFQLVPGCIDRQRNALIARCSGIYIPPQQQQIIIQQDGGQSQTSDLNKCMQDGGSLHCPNDPRTQIKPFNPFPKY